MHFYPNMLTWFKKMVRHSGFGQVLLLVVVAGLATAVFGLQSDVTLAQKESESSNVSYLPMMTWPGCYRYLEQNNLLVMEVEHAMAVDQWEVETALPGFTGDSYYTWKGPNYFGNPGNAILTYHIQIYNPGEFNFRLHNRHDFPDPTEDNDVWVRVDSEPWVKAFSPVAGQWTWGTFFDYGTSQTNASFLLSTGPHTIEISARSQDFSIDRIHLHKNAVHEDTSLPVSPCI